MTDKAHTASDGLHPETIFRSSGQGHRRGYRILRTIRRTLIFKQFFKKITFLPFLLLDCKDVGKCTWPNDAQSH
jgi:hypothetical protein